MQIVRTIVGVVLLLVLLIFSINNWSPVEVKIWEGLILETKIPALVITAFLLGLIPMWLLHRGVRWRMARRISALETAARSAAAAASAIAGDPAPAPDAAGTHFAINPEKPV
jgi:lipopolysaccharide assembly protein A